MPARLSSRRGALVLLASVGFATAMLGVPAAEHPRGTGPELYQQHCMSCHGSPPQEKMNQPYQDLDNPVLMGALRPTLLNLKAAPTPTMKANNVFVPLNASDLEQISAYLATQDPQAYSISGKVTKSLDPDFGIGGATVTLTSTYHPSVPAPTTTSQSGAYSFSGHDPGEYTVTVSHPAWTISPVSATVYLSIAGVQIAGKPGTLKVNTESLEQVNFTGTTAFTSVPYYADRCAKCHDGDPAGNKNKILNGARRSILEQLAQAGAHQGATPFTSPAPLTGAQLSNLAAFLAGRDANTYAIHGQVVQVGEPSKGISNIPVDVTSSYNPGTMTSTAAGIFQVVGLRAGDYSVTPKHAAYGFQPTSRNVGLSRAGVEIVGGTLQAGTSLQGVGFTGGLKPVFAEGKVLYDAHCAQCHGADPSLNQDALYGAALWLLESFKQEAIDKKPALQQKVANMEPLTGYEPMLLQSGVDTLSGEQLKKLSAYLSASYPKPWAIQGKVSFTAPGPGGSTLSGAIPQATVTVTSSLFPETRTALTAPDGTFLVDELLAGDKQMTVSKSGFTFDPAARTLSLHIHALPTLASETDEAYVLHEFTDFTGTLANLAAAGGSLYQQRCQECHGSKPEENQKNVLLGARLSQLQSIIAVTLPWGGPPGSNPPPPALPATPHLEDAVAGLAAVDRQALAAYLASRDPHKYTIRGEVTPLDTMGVPISLFSETVAGVVTTTGEDGNYEAKDLPAGDYVVSALPEEDLPVTPPAWDVYFTVRDVGIKDFVAYPALKMLGPDQTYLWLPQTLKNIDFSLGSPMMALIWSEAHKWLYELIKGYERGDAASLLPHLCPDFVAQYEGLGTRRAAEIERSVRTDTSQFKSIRLRVQVGRFHVDRRSGEVRVPVTWSRTAILAGTGQEWVVRDRTSALVLRRDPRNPRRFQLCGIRGAPLLGLSDFLGRLLIREGTLNGTPVRAPLWIWKGRPGAAPSRP